MTRLLAGAGACALLCGCALHPFENAKVDPASPVAAEVKRIANAGGPYPTFAAIPPIPKDVRPPAQYGRVAKATEAARDAVVQATGPGAFTLDAQAEIDAAQRAADATPQAPRTRATPPPPPQD